VDVEIVPGARGSFEVYRDATRVFSKLEGGRFPNSDDEVLNAL
jgi:selT/selW/selH-like putative selenoprotein